MTFPEKPLTLSLLIVTVLIACNRHVPTPSSTISRITASILHPARGEVSTVQPIQPRRVQPNPGKQVTFSFSSHYTGLVLLSGIGQNTADIGYVTRFYIRPVTMSSARTLILLINKQGKLREATIDDANDGMLYKLYDVQVIGKRFAGLAGSHAGEIWITLSVGFLRFRCGPPSCKKVTWGETTFGSR